MPVIDMRFSIRARARRWTEFMRRFPDLPDMRVLDLGGTPAFWEEARPRPAEVVAVNLDPRNRSTDHVKYVVADACEPPEDVRNESFDLVFSNSLIEHVGGYLQRGKLARTVASMAPHHWIQTPYRYFPIEPHWGLPMMQFLPIASRVAISRHLPYGPAHREMNSTSELVDGVAMVDLLSITEMRRYFPASAIWYERAAGLVKSVVAVR